MLTLVGTAVADRSNRSLLPPTLWAVELPASGTTAPPAAYVARLRAAGVNAVVVDATTATIARIARIGSTLASSGLAVLVSTPIGRCTSLRAPLVCAQRATSIPMALRVARAGSAPTVVHASRVVVLARLARSRGRIVAVVPYDAAIADPAAWTRAIGLARSSKLLDLAVGPREAKATATATATETDGVANPFPGLRPGPTSPAPAPFAPPGPVQNLRAQSVDPSSVVLAWDPPAVGAADHYELFQDGAALGTTAVVSATFSGLTCGVSVALGVEAVAAAGTHSLRAALAVVPPCAPRPGGGGGDTTPPAVTILSAPAAVTNGTTALLAFSSSELSTFECSLDGSAFVACTSPATYAGVAAGAHTFRVRATDVAGNVSVPSSYGWTVDTSAPEASITAQPDSPTSSTSATFSFTSTEAGSSFECELDDQVFAVCTAPISYAGLADGGHTFQVRATDTAGNTDATPASLSWTVDTTPPDTTITVAPADPSSSTSASFSFSSSEPGSTFQCELDGAGLAPCSPPVSYSGLAELPHTFHVQATDAAGNGDPTPAGSTWTVLTANVFLSTTGNDATCVRGDSSRPCKTFNEAFQVALGGDIVEVAGGTYSEPGQINVDEHSPAISAAVTFRPAPAATVLLGVSIDIRASHFHMIGISSAGSGETRNSLAVCAGATECPTELADVFVQSFSGKSAFIRSSGVTVRGGEFGNYDPCLSGNSEDIFRLWGGGGAAQPNDDVVDGVTLHDDDDHHTTTACAGTANAGIHADCLQGQGGTNITIENTTMYDCATSNIQAQPFGGATMSNWVVENNFFGNVLHPGNSVVLGLGNCSTLVLRYNTFLGPQPNAGGCTSGNLVGYGNVFLANASATSPNFDQSWSVFTPRSTALVNLGSSHDNKKCDPVVIGAGSLPPNLHLGLPDTCARGAGDPANFPAADIDGDPRPAGGGAPDAGADEVP